MAEPAFIYAFDILGPERFTELCGHLLGSQFKGFALGGVGADSGIDGESENDFGLWHPEAESVLDDEVIAPEQLVVFQFKHIVIARAGGQTKAREKLLSLYRCTKTRLCEIHRPLIVQRQPTCYVLVTNAEVNSNFRAKFIEHCRSHNPSINQYKVFGLDDLINRVKMEIRLRHLYFPTIFGPPQFALQIQLSEGFADFYPDETLLGFGMQRTQTPTNAEDSSDLFQVSILNIGAVPSFVDAIQFKLIVDGKVAYFPWMESFLSPDEGKALNNPKYGTALEPGRKQLFSLPFHLLGKIRQIGNKVFPDEVIVHDQIGNVYSAKIPQDLRNKMLSYP